RHPGAIELQAPDGRTRQPVERADSATDLVDHEPDAESCQGTDVSRLTRDESLLRDPQLQAFRGHSSLLEKTRDVADEVLVQQVVAERPEGNADIRIRGRGESDEVVPQMAEHGTRQSRREPRGLGRTQEFRRTHLAAQWMVPAEVADPGHEPAGREI